MEKLLAEKTLLGKKLGEILVSLGKISQEQLERAILARPKDRMRIGEYLIQKGLIEEDDLLEALSKQLGLEYRKTLIGTGTNIESFTLSRQFVKKFYAIILKEGEDFVELALNDPLNIELIENIKSLTGKKTYLVLAKKIEIIKLADILAGESAESADDVLEDLDEEVNGFQVLSEESLSETDVLDMANEAPIIKLVNLIITEALKQRASDIHIEPSEHSVTVRYRIDGMLHTVLNPPKRYQQPIVSRIKIMANLNIAENRLPQDGRIKVKYGASDIDIRVSIVPSVAGERVVMRLLRKEASSYQLEKLGMNKNILNDFRETLSIPHGIIIVSGPTGSGKTTTLYAAIREINTPEKNIITIEDPVEYRIEGVSQIQVNPRINLTFANGLRSILRQDPEVIMVGEIRDRETAEIAIQAAMTGHLVFSTLHTNDAASSIVRLLDMGIEPYLIASTATCFISQRLVRVLCNNCKSETTLDPDFLKQAGINPESLLGKTVFKPVGCGKCMNTGFYGRTGIFEMIKVDDSVRRMIVEKRDASYVRNECNKRGFKTILEDGIDKVLNGITSIEEVLRVIRD